MRYRAWVAVAAWSLSLAFTGCGGSSDSRNTSAETPQAAESAETPQASDRLSTRRVGRERGGVGSGGWRAPAGHLLGGARRSLGGP